MKRVKKVGSEIEFLTECYYIIYVTVVVLDGEKKCVQNVNFCLLLNHIII